MINILNMQLARKNGKSKLFSSLTEKQGGKKSIKTERLQAVLSREGRTERKHQSGLQREERLLQ